MKKTILIFIVFQFYFYANSQEKFVDILKKLSVYNLKINTKLEEIESDYFSMLRKKQNFEPISTIRFAVVHGYDIDYGDMYEYFYYEKKDEKIRIKQVLDISYLNIYNTTYNELKEKLSIEQSDLNKLNTKVWNFDTVSLFENLESPGWKDSSQVFPQMSFFDIIRKIPQEKIAITDSLRVIDCHNKGYFEDNENDILKENLYVILDQEASYTILCPLNINIIERIKNSEKEKIDCASMRLILIEQADKRIFEIMFTESTLSLIKKENICRT